MKVRINGIHSAIKRLASGEYRVYLYHGRGGPRIATATGQSSTAAYKAAAEALSDAAVQGKLDASRAARSAPMRPDLRTTSGVVAAYLASPEWSGLAAVTRRNWRPRIAEFSDAFGEWPLSVWDKPATVQDVAEWRDEIADRPRAAQMRIQIVSRVFSWARSRGLTRAEPTRHLPSIYRVDRSDRIWDDAAIAQLLAACDNESGALAQAVKLALATGLRRGDLIRLTWSAVREHAIVWRTSKTGRDVVIPILPSLAAILAAIPRRSPVILTTAAGRPWDGRNLARQFDAARSRAGISDLRWHDFRGTAATRFAAADLSAREIALILGWSESDVEAMMRRYVSADKIAQGLIDRMAARRETHEER